MRFIMERFKRLLGIGPSLEELIVDLSIYTKQVGRQQKKYAQREDDLKKKAKKEILEGETIKAKMYMKQSLNAKNASASLDMFVISMENLIFDLKNASSINMMGSVMGKISKTLQKLDLLKTSNISKIMGKVNNQMEKAGFNMEQIFDQIKDYDPFTITEFSDVDVDKELEKITDEVIAEVPALGLPASKIEELQKKREDLRNR